MCVADVRENKGSEIKLNWISNLDDLGGGDLVNQDGKMTRG